MASSFGRFAVGAALVASVGCGGAVESDTGAQDLDLNEATSSLVVADEGGSTDAEALSATTDGDLDLSADEGADVDATAVPETAGDVCDFGDRRQKVLDLYDTNGDGKLDDGERVALRQDLGWRFDHHPRFAALAWRFRIHAFQALRWTFDEDGSGTLSDDERGQMVSALESRCELIHQRRLDQFDVNHDGVLDSSEREAARASRRAELQSKYQEILTKYDLDGSGRLELSERLTLRADLRAAAKARRDALLAKYDIDSDGKLSTAEALPLREAIQQRLADGKAADEA